MIVCVVSVIVSVWAVCVCVAVCVFGVDDGSVGTTPDTYHHYHTERYRHIRTRIITTYPHTHTLTSPSSSICVGDGVRDWFITIMARS